ncbi:hypothetical protein [Streptomyces sp. NPDC127036]|uniref:hypothetical protein n=1 Tax=unclassified Streptomyces TaxID=2593676 RepID=UPI0036507405
MSIKITLWGCAGEAVPCAAQEGGVVVEAAVVVVEDGVDQAAQCFGQWYFVGVVACWSVSSRASVMPSV